MSKLNADASNLLLRFLFGHTLHRVTWQTGTMQDELMKQDLES